MNIQVAVLCDAATDDNGKLNLLGAFDTIYTQQLPAVHPQCSIALRVTFFGGDVAFFPVSPPPPGGVGRPEVLRLGPGNYIGNTGNLKYETPGLFSFAPM